MQELDEWAEKISKGDLLHEHARFGAGALYSCNAESTPGPFRKASVWRSDSESSADSKALSFPRAYSLTLSPQIIYSKSKLLSQLVSSKVYRQLEFQAVGNWWIYAPNTESVYSHGATLKRLPNGREDIFEDGSIENRSKRSLMKFVKFVIEYEDHRDIWESHAESGLPQFLASKFQLSPHLQNVICALSLSLYPPEETPVGYALPRIARHLTSIGVFGPGFGAIVPKWGGGAEIAQVACRAGAVGGGVYVLGTGISSSHPNADNGRIEVGLSNGEKVTTKHLSRNAKPASDLETDTIAVSRLIAVASCPFTSLFENSVEGSPVPAVSVIVFPPGVLNTGHISHSHPVYIMAHSSDTGECPAEQCQYISLCFSYTH